MSRWGDEFEAEHLFPIPCAISAISAIRSESGVKTDLMAPNGTNGTGKSDKLSQSDHVRVLSPPSTSELDKQPEWDSETCKLIDWFSDTIPQAEPFELCKGVTILDPARWWQSINGDVASGPNGPRARYGAVQGDLRRLYQRFCEADDQQSKAVRDD